MMCSQSLSEATCFNLEQPVDSQAEPVVISRQVQPVWRVKRRSALDRHAAFVKRLERQRLAREKHRKEGAESKDHAESRLHSFTTKLRHAILHNADVASVWRPAARMLDVKAILDRKLNDQWLAKSASQASRVAGGNPALPNDLLDEMSQFVDKALRDAPAGCNSPTTSIAALASTSNTAGSVSCAEIQTSADYHEAGAEVLSQQMPDQAAYKLPERAEQACKRCSDRLGSSGSVKSIGSKKVNKPAWAMTADAAFDAEQQEEEDLLAFAGGLEFEKYIHQQEDAELRSALQEMRTAHESDSDAKKALKKHVVRAINNLANKDVKPGEGSTGHGAQSCGQRSEAAASTFSRATVASKAKDATSNPALLADPAATTKWDTSTRAGSDVGSMGKQNLKAGCGELFRENPEMKQVHSLASAAALLKRVADSSAA